MSFHLFGLIGFAEFFVVAQEAAGGSATSWAPAYLVVILTLVFAMMIVLAPSRRSDKPRDIEFKGTSWGKVVTAESEKKQPEGPPPGVFAPGQLAKKRK